MNLSQELIVVLAALAAGLLLAGLILIFNIKLYRSLQDHKP